MRVDAPGPVHPYEVHCNRCRVSHPLGTRRCIHCGGPVQPEPPRRPTGRLRREGGGGRPELVVAPAPASEPMDPDEIETPQRGGLSPFTFMWVLLALFGAMYRVCTPG